MIYNTLGNFNENNLQAATIMFSLCLGYKMQTCNADS